MKYILTEKQIGKLIVEDRAYDIRSAIKSLNKMIDNFDSIDCKNELLIYDNEYVEIYCSQLHGATLDELKEIKEKMANELSSLVSREFRSKIN